jgi:pyridoxamine 5'-phosphate oxidase family protein
MVFTDDEIAYMRSQTLGRLATIAPDGFPQNNPVGFTVNTELGTIDIRGYNMAESRKFTNVRANPRVAFVVDDIASTDPWKVRGIEIRGNAEAIDGDSALIRIRPTRIGYWNDHARKARSV